MMLDEKCKTVANRSMWRLKFFAFRWKNTTKNDIIGLCEGGGQANDSTLTTY